ncbi:hypothetical protein [Polaromonas sp. CG9_12]|nr:hypothetical protein [Polaromonas sp. CG9_12]
MPVTGAARHPRLRFSAACAPWSWPAGRQRTGKWRAVSCLGRMLFYYELNSCLGIFFLRQRLFWLKKWCVFQGGGLWLAPGRTACGGAGLCRSKNDPALG